MKIPLSGEELPVMASHQAKVSDVVVVVVLDKLLVIVSGVMLLVVLV